MGGGGAAAATGAALPMLEAEGHWGESPGTTTPPHTHTRAHAHTPGRYTRAAGIGLRARPPSRVRTAPGRRVAAGGRRGAALGLPTPVVREVPYGYLLFFIIRGVCVCV